MKLTIYQYAGLLGQTHSAVLVRITRAVKLYKQKGIITDPIIAWCNYHPEKRKKDGRWLLNIPKYEIEYIKKREKKLLELNKK